MAMLKLTLAITIVGIMVETAILAIQAMAIGVINVAILWNQLNSIKKLAKWCLIHSYESNLQFRYYHVFVVILSFYNVKMSILLGQFCKKLYILLPKFLGTSFSRMIIAPQYGLECKFFLFTKVLFYSTLKTKLQIRTTSNQKKYSKKVFIGS